MSPLRLDKLGYKVDADVPPDGCADDCGDCVVPVPDPCELFSGGGKGSFCTAAGRLIGGCLLCEPVVGTWNGGGDGEADVSMPADLRATNCILAAAAEAAAAVQW